MSEIFKIDTVVTEDGTVLLKEVPFHPGEHIEVIVRSRPANETTEYPLRGQRVTYIRPTDPTAEDEWEAGR